MFKNLERWSEQEYVRRLFSQNNLSIHSKKDAERIRRLPTILKGQSADLKLESTTEGEWAGCTRIWVSRMTVADGAKKSYQVVMEHRYFRRLTGEWRLFHGHGFAESVH